jgi:hypothetical protein
LPCSLRPWQSPPRTLPWCAFSFHFCVNEFKSKHTIWICTLSKDDLNRASFPDKSQNIGPNPLASHPCSFLPKTWSVRSVGHVNFSRGKAL